jgi:hypothetical protein
MKKIKLNFKNAKSQTESITYTLADNIIANKWIKKIKHLQKIKPSETETSGYHKGTLENLHKEYCQFAGIEYFDMDYSQQSSLNVLHETYEQNHERLSRQENNEIIYRFHQAIHAQETQYEKTLYHYVGWGTMEGPLTEIFNCNEHYADAMLKNNIYLPWSELGKTPLHYFEDKEPSHIERIFELVKPHVTLRTKFVICKGDKTVKKLSKEFKDWFQPYKNPWLNYYSITDWQARDEQSGVLLAECDDHVLDIKLFLDTYPLFDSIVILSS